MNYYIKQVSFVGTMCVCGRSTISVFYFDGKMVCLGCGWKYDGADLLIYDSTTLVKQPIGEFIKKLCW